MTIDEDIKKGMEIRDKYFNANPYAELKALREAIFALYIKQDINATQEQKTWANNKVQEMLALNEKITNANS